MLVDIVTVVGRNQWRLNCARNFKQLWIGGFLLGDPVILDFNKEIYGENLRVEFVQKVRAEQKFNGLDALKAQIAQDKLTVSDILK